MTSQTSAIGVDIASDKSLTNRLLDSAGLPVPRADGRRRRRTRRSRPRKRIGFPCVVKPLDGNHGRGVHLDLRSEEEVRAAFHGRARRRAAPATSSSRRTSPATTTAASSSAARSPRSPSACPASVTGDGEHTVRQLVDIANADPRRGIGHEKVLTRIKVDEAAEELVRAQGFELDDVPARRAPGSSSP